MGQELADLAHLQTTTRRTKMDSCHIFNFLFGTKKATTELRRCFTTFGENATKKSREKGTGGGRSRERRCDTQTTSAPPSPLKQLQMRIANHFTSGSALGANSSSRSNKTTTTIATPKPTTNTEQRKRSISCDAKCGTYRATLVESIDGPGENEEDELEQISVAKATEIIENPLSQLDNELSPVSSCESHHNDKENDSFVLKTIIADRSYSVSSLMVVEPMQTEPSPPIDTTTTSLQRTEQTSPELEPSTAMQLDANSNDNNKNKQKQYTTKFKRVVLYDDDYDSRQLERQSRHNQQQQQQIISSGAEVYNIVSEFGDARAKLRRISSSTWNEDNIADVNSNLNNRQLEIGCKEAEGADKSRRETCASLRDKRSVYVRSLVQSIESNKSFESLLSQTETATKTTQPPSTKSPRNPSVEHGPIVYGQYTPTKPITIVKPLPPPTPPKTNKAKCLNMQLNLNKPVKIQQLFQDEGFLTRFFDKLEPLDRCVAAQVCRLWRNILYANRNYWKDLVNVIDCTQLRREHLVECIINTLQSAKLKQQRTGEPLREPSHRLVKGIRSNYKLDQSSTQPTTGNNEWSLSSPTFGSANMNAGRQFDLQDQQQTSNLLDNSNSYYCNNNRSSADFYLDTIDQDDVWRIQELCNRFTQRAGHGSMSRQQITDSNNNHSHNQNGDQTNTTTCMTSKSSSIPSQISSTFSSVSLSSLLSPLSESSRIESIKEKLYTSLDDRGFDAICLFGATDDDIDDLVSKIPVGAHKRIVVGRLNNCSITDRGLEQFILTFSQIEELELSGCNEITNSFELKTLANLKRLIITDCINIADGLAQKLIQVVHQLDELTIQAYHLTDAFLEYLSLNSDTSKLKRLELPNCKEITNQSLITMAKHFPQLDTLSISGSTKISDDGIEILAEQARLLKSLDLSWCSRISDASLECIACDLGDTLTDLILDRNVHITDTGLGYLATMSKLTSLHIRWCPRITDIGLESVVAVRSLRYLSLAGTHQVTARSLLCLVETDLLEVELTNCQAVNSDLLLFLTSKMPKCNIIF